MAGAKGHGSSFRNEGGIDWRLLTFCIFLCLSIGFLGSFFTAPKIGEWYAALVKPVWNPPNWVFGPVWTLLYAMLGGCLYMIIRDGGGFFSLGKKDGEHVMALFYSQLGLNLSWSVVFFGWENVGGALFIIFMMILFTIALMVSSYRRGLEKVVLLLVPYLAWISFASMLNLSILFLQA